MRSKKHLKFWTEVRNRLVTASMDYIYRGIRNIYDYFLSVPVIDDIPQAMECQHLQLEKIEQIEQIEEKEKLNLMRWDPSCLKLIRVPLH